MNTQQKIGLTIFAASTVYTIAAVYADYVIIKRTSKQIMEDRLKLQATLMEAEANGGFTPPERKGSIIVDATNCLKHNLKQTVFRVNGFARKIIINRKFK